MLNRAAFWNTLPDGVAVLEIPREGEERSFVPLRETTLAGEVAGPLAALRVTHTFGYTRADFDRPIEALYRFPLPGDAAITAVSVRFGEVAIDAELRDRERAEAAYGAAKEAGQAAALVTRESPNVFTLHLTGLAPDQPIVVATSYAHLALPTAEGWSLRLPLTTAPRYVREDERGSRAAEGQPLMVLRDPGHRFSLDLLIRAAGAIDSPTHALAVTPASPTERGAVIKEGLEGEDRRVALRDGAIVPDRDCVIAWRPQQEPSRPLLTVLTQDDRAAGETYFLATLAPPSVPAPEEASAREAILLVDHSGSMSGAKWEAADWATRRFLGDLTPRDTFALGLFHDRTAWFASRPEAATPEAMIGATDFLLANKGSGGTNLGVALEQALALPRDRPGRARHLLIVTDAEVSDADRILRLADEEARRDDRRRISVLCIDAAPNGYLATELAERGGGVVRFLTSAPDEGDITGALDAILADWAAPTRLDVRLANDGVSIEGAQGGAAPTLPLGDLPAGRTVWAVGRVPAATAPATFRASDSVGTFAEVQATALPDDALLPALKALFGARRVLALEHLQGAGYAPDESRAALARLGYDPALALASTGGEHKVYQENARAETLGTLRALLVSEALRYGLASAETAFVAVRREAGERVAATVVVANALPAGWSPAFAAGGGARGARFMAMAAFAMPAGRASDQRFVPRQTGGRSGMVDKLTGVFASAAPPSVPAPASAPMPRDGGATTIFSGVPQVASGGATLFDAATADAAALPAPGRLTRLIVRFPDGTRPETLDPSLILDLFVDDLAAPRVSVSLAALAAQGGTRPLNLAWRVGQALRLILRDPSGRCAREGLTLEIALA
jgi:Ca-activated chloride channel family protein